MIYFVRHGQTDDNVGSGILTGWNEVPLNDVGISQAKQTAQELADVRFDICFCSPLLRARQTLNEILKYQKDLKIIYDDRIKERDYGELTGKPVELYNFPRWDSKIKIPYKMESVEDMFERVANFYDDLKKKYAGRTILIVAHSGVSRLSNAYFYGKPKDGDYSKLGIGNAKVVKFEF